MPFPNDLDNPTPEEQTALDAAFSVYYRVGQSVTIDPPTIPGYTTPAVQTFNLASAENQASYIYTTQAVSSPESPGGPGSDSGLAETGDSLYLLLAIAATSLLVGTKLVLAARS